jgi:cytochrome oxidase assembly protein ShyY1
MSRPSPPPQAPHGRGIYHGRVLRVALRPRFLGLLALMVVATLVCGLLATWQWDRAHRALTEQTGQDRSLGQLQDVVEPGKAVTNALAGGIVEAQGEYDPDQQVLVPGRRIDGQEAVIVVTALHVRTSDGDEALLPVARGWIDEDAVMGEDGEVDPSRAPAPPTGTVTVSGRLEASESASNGLEDGVAQEIATPLLVNEWGSPMYAGYVGQTASADGLQGLPAAESAFSSGLNWQNLGYALQWVLFGGFFLYLWWRSVRTAYLDELAARREELQSRLSAAADGDTTVGRSPADPTTKGETGADSAPTR